MSIEQSLGFLYYFRDNSGFSFSVFVIDFLLQVLKTGSHFIFLPIGDGGGGNVLGQIGDQLQKITWG